MSLSLPSTDDTSVSYSHTDNYADGALTWVCVEVHPEHGQILLHTACFSNGEISPERATPSSTAEPGLRTGLSLTVEGNRWVGRGWWRLDAAHARGCPSTRSPEKSLSTSSDCTSVLEFSPVLNWCFLIEVRARGRSVVGVAAPRIIIPGSVQDCALLKMKGV